MSEKIGTLATIAPDDGEPNVDLVKPAEGTTTTAAAAVAARLAGASYGEIATLYGYSSPFAARQAVESAIARSSADAESVAEVRDMTARRLDRLLRSVFPSATNPKNPDHLGYVKTALAIIDRKAKLYGADAPQQVVVHTPAAEKVAAWIEGMVAQVGGPENAVREADIFDAEVVEADEEMG